MAFLQKPSSQEDYASFALSDCTVLQEGDDSAEVALLSAAC
jgi:hypothetical protein